MFKNETKFFNKFEIVPVNGKRKFINKSGFKIKCETQETGNKVWFVSYNKSYEKLQSKFVELTLQKFGKELDDEKFILINLEESYN